MIDSLPKNIARYFYPVSLERARAVVSLLVTYNKESSSAYEFEYTADTINTMSEKLSRYLVMAAKPYENRIIDYGDERYVNEIYGKAMTNLLKIKSRYLISREKIVQHEHQNS